jgi:hypothetical protein
MKVSIVGLDLAKSIFHVVCFDERFKEQRKRILCRNQVLLFNGKRSLLLIINQKRLWSKQR